MSLTVTPEKVKNLLSTFLASSKQQSPHRISTVCNTLAGSRSEVGATDISVNATTPTKAGTSSLRSYESFLERLDTFTSLTWFGKPAELSPLICARFGWANVETDSLQCVGCKAHLCGKLPDQSDSNAYKVFKEKLKKDILAGHDKFCVLAANPCPESFCLIPCDDPTSLISGFTQRVSSIESVTCSLPNLDYSTLHSHNYDEGQGAAYCKRLLLPDSDTAPEVVALSLTGWSCMPSKTDILFCTRCRRHVGLWNFDKQSSHSFYGNGNSESVGEQNDDGKEPANKVPKVQVKSSFNPVEEHKHWCPWVLQTQVSSPSSSSSSSSSTTTSPVGGKRQREEESSLPAFILALKTIAPGLMDNNTGLAQAMKVSPMTDGLRCFRRVMKAWSSPKTATTSPPPSGKASTPPSSKAS